MCAGWALGVRLRHFAISIQSWGMALLKNLAAGEGDPVTVGLHQQLLQYQVVVMLHLLADALAERNCMSRIFQ